MTRIGASQAFFNIVANFNAEKLITDTKSLNTVVKAVQLDTFEAMLKPLQDFGMAVDTAIGMTKDLAVELGQAGVEFEKFFGEENIRETTDALIDLGLEFNKSFNESLAAGSRSAQVANLIGRENVELLTRQGMILAEISDLTVEEAQKGIIKLQQQTGVLFDQRSQAEFEQLGLMQQRAILTDRSAFALDALNTIANRSVALEGDLVQTMTNFAAQGRLAGDSFEFMAAASAVMLEAGEEAGTAGRALRMTYARLGGNINGTADKLEAMGFQLRTQSGEMKTMQEILQELSDKGFHELTGQQQQNIAQIIAGNRHYVRFIKLMENLDRATQLAKEGFEGLDSAQEQAEKALADNANLLEIEEKRVESFQAAIGRDMAEFMIGSTKLKADYLEVVHEIEKGTGALGELIGRAFQTFKVTGGFIKMGLAVRSLAVGMEIMHSVQRAVQGIEIANRQLHSKQADYFDGRKDLLDHEKAALTVVQKMTQKINLAMERQNMARKQAVPLERALKGLEEHRLHFEETLATKTNARLRTMQDIRFVKKAINKIDKAGDDLTARRNAQHQLALDLEIDSEQNLKDILGQRGATQRAMTSQLQTHVDMFSNMDSHQKGMLTKNRNMTRSMHDGLQVMMSANKLARDTRNAETLRGRASLELLTNSQKTVDVMTKQFAIQKKSAEVIAQTERAKPEQEQNQQLINEMENRVSVLDKLQGFMDEGEFLTGKKGEGRFTGSDFRVLEDLAKEYQGLFIATEQSFDLMNLQLFESGELTDRLSRKTELLKQMEDSDGRQFDQELLNSIMESEVELKEKLLPLTQEIAEAEKMGADTAAKRAELTSELSKGIAQDNEAIKDAIKTQDNFNMTLAQSRQHMAQLNSSVGIGAGMLGGLIGGSKGATLSLVGLSSHLAMTAKEAGGAAVALMKTQAAMTKAAFEANITAGSMKALGAVMASLKGLALNLAVIGGLTLVFNTIREAQESFNKSMEDSIERIDGFQQSLDRLGQGNASEQTLFGNNEGLAELLGVDDVSMKELSTNVELVDSLLATIEEKDLDLDGQMGAGLKDIVTDLEALSAILKEESIPNLELFDEINRKIERQFKGGEGGFLGLKELIPFEADYSMKERNATKAFVRDMIETGKITDDILEDFGGRFIASDNAVDNIRRNAPLSREALKKAIRMTVATLREGKTLTEEQLDAFEKMGSGAFFDNIVKAVREMNDLIITGDEAALVMARFAEEIDNSVEGLNSQTTEVENLVDEMRNFANAREELFFGGQYGNITGSLYKQVVTQGVGTLYNKQEIIVSNVFHGFFNEQEAALRISSIVEKELEMRL